MTSEHRQALQRVRIESANALQLHRRILNRQREIARLALSAERSRAQQARSQYQRDLESARAQAQEYRIVWLQAKKDGARLLRFVDQHLKRAA